MRWNKQNWKKENVTIGRLKNKNYGIHYLLDLQLNHKSSSPLLITTSKMSTDVMLECHKDN
ncbi:CLUMA_CG013767, isoform A [Clunio marinus]|uniref:CLUMA_CG013758, isoform A n=1 Tax=Clunio marinus TaxID=568069 RepID=A0A1J1IPR7_9DIPT|nr:CLUMA_CG013758, isoform A [Clunio marinus]CRL00506.1 CLUMA_CG013767, isoform A [Clunio marinus]